MMVQLGLSYVYNFWLKKGELKGAKKGIKKVPKMVRGQKIHQIPILFTGGATCARPT